MADGVQTWRAGRILSLLAALLVLAGCGENGPGEAPAPREPVKLALVAWSSEVASTHVVAAVLEEQGLAVELVSTDAEGAWRRVAEGEVDAMPGAWLPTTHADYQDRFGEGVDDLGPNLEGTRVGLVVPGYVAIDTIGELADQATRFDDRIVGIDPETGLMRATAEAMEAYGLDDMELVAGDAARMATALEQAIAEREPIVVTGWTPHWMFARWDLKYLADPKGVFGGEERIHTLARPGLAEERPEAYRILDAFRWTPAEMEQVMAWNRERGADPAANARRWVHANPERVREWTE